MKNCLELCFQSTEMSYITVYINNICKYDGVISDLKLDFDICTNNELRIDFYQVKGHVKIIDICYNHLSIEHFIYQGQFTESGSSEKLFRTDVYCEGSWTYSFDHNLGKQIIKANI